MSLYENKKLALQNRFRMDIEMVNNEPLENTLVMFNPLTCDITIAAIVINARQYVPNKDDEITAEEIILRNRRSKVEYAASWQDVDRRQSRYRSYLYRHYIRLYQETLYDQEEIVLAASREIDLIENDLNQELAQLLADSCYKDDIAGAYWQYLGRRRDSYRFNLYMFYYALYGRFMDTTAATNQASNDCEVLNQSFITQRDMDIKLFWPQECPL